MAHIPQSARNRSATLRTRSQELRRVAAMALKQNAETRKEANPRKTDSDKKATDDLEKPAGC